MRLHAWGIFLSDTLILYSFINADICILQKRRRLGFVPAVLILVMFLPHKHVMLCPLLYD